MIISASRRTDIPAFHMDWLLERLREGWVRVSHPMIPRQSRLVSLQPQDVDGFVFWSKNPDRLLREEVIAAWPFYVQFTLNAYPASVEPGVPPLCERLSTFAALAERFGPDRVLWRYDPILLCEGMRDAAAHLEAFARLAGALEGRTQRCTISFLQPYRKSAQRQRQAHVLPLLGEEHADLAARLAHIARQSGMQLCACTVDVPGVAKAKCVDAALLARIADRPVCARKAVGQRPGCGCDHSADIGAYDTCRHGCVYCYACTGG